MWSQISVVKMLFQEPTKLWLKKKKGDSWFQRKVWAGVPWVWSFRIAFPHWPWRQQRDGLSMMPKWNVSWPSTFHISVTTIYRLCILKDKLLFSEDLCYILKLTAPGWSSHIKRTMSFSADGWCLLRTVEMSVPHPGSYLTEVWALWCRG